MQTKHKNKSNNDYNTAAYISEKQQKVLKISELKIQ